MAAIKFIVLAKPLTVELGRTRVIDSFVSFMGATIVSKKELVCDSSKIANHYRQFVGKGFFQPLVEYYTGKGIVAYACVCNNIETLMAIREAIGGAKVDQGSFRDQLVGDVFTERLQATGVVDNGIHCSDSVEEGIREFHVWFGVPPTSSHTKMAHKAVWKLLDSIQQVDSLQYAGGEHDGTAVTGSVIDLDYRLLTNNMPYVVSQLEKLGLVIDKRGIDDFSGADYVKFEIGFTNGKVDIAVVPTAHYANQVSKSHLLYLVKDALKSECRAAKAVAKATGNKQLYKDTKRQWRKYLLESINWIA